MSTADLVDRLLALEVSALCDADTLKAEAGRLDALAERGYYNERLDQLVVEVLLGAR